MFVSYEKRTGGYAVVSIQREPVNALSLELWQELRNTLTELEKDPSVRGVIFSSGLKRDIFTAGNDLGELYAPNTSLERYVKFWTVQNTFLAALYSSPLVTVAAVRGQCPAGGCILSMCCDFKVMTENGSIGLNEVALGIPVPVYWAELMCKIVGHAIGDKLLQTAKLLNPQEALSVGLIDKIVAKDELLPHSERAMQMLLKLPDPGRQETKLRLRGEFSQQWSGFAPTEAIAAWDYLCKEKVVQLLGGVMQRLSGRKSKL